MRYKDAYRDWFSWCDDAEKKELLLLKDEKEIEDRFPYIVPIHAV